MSDKITSGKTIYRTAEEMPSGGLIIFYGEHVKCTNDQQFIIELPDNFFDDEHKKHAAYIAEKKVIKDMVYEQN